MQADHSYVPPGLQIDADLRLLDPTDDQLRGDGACTLLGSRFITVGCAITMTEHKEQADGDEETKQEQGEQDEERKGLDQ